MKKYYFKSILFILFFPVLSYSQTQFWSDTFEDTGAPSSGARSSSIEYGVLTAPYVGYFKRTDGTDISLNLSLPYTSGEGTKYWAAEDIDRDVTGTQNAQSDVQTITWNNINISGKNGLSFSGLFAAWNGNPVSDGNSIWEGTGHPAGADYMEVEYSIDGGSYTKIIGVYCHTIGNASGILKLDTNGDLIGDAFSLSRSFQNFSATISGTGNLLSLRFKARTASLVEEMAIDNFRLFETPACPLVSATTSQTNVSCNGGINGSATVVASGGTSFTYAWAPSGGSAATASSLSAGNYTCTITNQCGNSTTRNFTITQPSAISVTALSQTNISCNGGSNGAASVSAATGGAGGYTYNWTPGNPTGDGTTSVTGLTAGTWTCAVTDANSCTSSTTFNVTQPTALSLTPLSQTNISCNGGSNGAASVNTATGGAGAFTYNWTPGNPTGDGTTSVTGLTAGTWTCAVTDANSCTRTQSFNITQPTALSVTALSQTNISCNGGSNGAAIVNAATGGAGGYMYNWTPGNPTGDGTTAVTGLTTGTWTCTVTDANSCTAMQTFNITQPTALVLTPASQTNISCNGSSNGAASVNAAIGGAGGYTYNWTPGNPIGDGTTIVTGLTAGTWTCTVTDANSCTRTQTFNITQPASALSTATAVANVSCFGGSNGSATVTANGGTSSYTYLWSTGATTSVITSQSLGTKSYTVSDANGCTSSGNVVVSQPTQISANISSNPTSCTGNTGSASVTSPSGGAGGYTYSWAPSGGTTSTATALGVGSYTCTITDANACSITKTVSVITASGPSLTSLTQTNVACFGNSTGAASVNNATGGAGGYSYNWTPGNPTGDGTTSVTGLTAQVYTCTVTDANGCSAFQTFNITQPTSALATSTAVTNVACFSNSTGAATVTATGGTSAYSYLWSTGATTSVITSQTSGVKSVTVTDVNGCTSVKSVSISQPASALATSTAVTNVACFGNTTGTATVTAIGGTSAYSYLWSTGATTSVITSQTSGTRSYTVTDANGCTNSGNVIISQPASALVTLATMSDVLCNGGSTGSATVTVTGGTPAYSYLWSTGATTSVIATQASGVKTVTVTDANGCTSVNSVNISEPGLLTANSTASSILCNGGTSSVTVSATGGTGTYTGTGTFTAMAGTQTYTVSDANGCSATTSITITEPAFLTAGASASSVLCHGGISSITVTANAGTAPYTGVGTFTVMAGTQTYTVTDNNGCTATTSVAITEPAALIASSTASAILCNGGISTITVTANDGTAPYTGVGTFTAMAGTQTYTITDNNGCTATTSVTITEPTAITASLSYTLCQGQSVTVAASTYSIAGTYTDVIASQLNGCDSTITTDVMVNALPNITVNSGTICSGQSFTIVPTGADSYTISGGSDVVMPTADATYTVSGTDANGCENAALSTVSVNALPTIMATTNNTLLCTGETATLSVSGADTYTWSTSENGADIAVSPTSTTTYTVEGTDANGCSSSTTITQDVSLCTDIASLNTNEAIMNVYPNPTNGVFMLELSSDAKVIITNAMGQTIVNEEMSSGKHNMDLKNQADGVYFIKIIENKKQHSLRLIKK